MGKQKKKLINIALIIIGILFILCIIGGFVSYCKPEGFRMVTRKIKETFAQTDTVNGVTFRDEGNGSAVDIQAVKKYLQPSSGGEQLAEIEGVTNVNGDPIKVTHPQYRATHGFVPPSFAYFPFGINSKKYKIYNKSNKNQDEGNKLCKEACAKTPGCIAVQTEVPQNCSMRRVSTADGDKHACGDSSEASCTLFYDTVENADDGYYDLYKDFIDKTGRNDAMGEKYYIYSVSPEPTPTIGQKPSEATVKWCPPNIVHPTTADNTQWLEAPDYATKPDALQECTCSGKPNEVCEDSNCCKYRELVTTEGAKYRSPYYNLPYSILEKDLCLGVSQGKDCGLINGEYKSCPIYKEGDENIPSGEATWDTKEQCSDEALEEEMINKCYTRAIKNWNSNRPQAIYDLTHDDDDHKCCFFRTKACIVRSIQPNCQPDNPDFVRRGCYGDPYILAVQNVGTEGITAISNDAVIPPDQRCANKGNALCTNGFAYGSSEKAGKLWVVTSSSPSASS